VVEHAGRVMHGAVRIGDAVLEMGEPEDRSGVPSGVSSCAWTMSRQRMRGRSRLGPSRFGRPTIFRTDTVPRSCEKCGGRPAVERAAEVVLKG
jgi:hypothetical protein